MLKNLNYITNNWSEKWILYLFLCYEMHDDFWVLSYWQLLVYLISTEKRNSKGKYSSWVGYWTWKENNFQKEFQPEEFCQEGVLKFFAKIRRNPQCRSDSLNKLQILNLHLYWKSDSDTSVFLEFCAIFRNTVSYRTPPVAVSKRDLFSSKREQQERRTEGQLWLSCICGLVCCIS